jgi:hypothetical protein
MQTAVDIFQWVGGLAFLLCLTIFPILAIFKRTRAVSAIGYFVSSVLFGLGLWSISALVVASYWGTWAVIIGTFLLGVGVLPMALVIIVWHHLWELLIPMAAWAIPLVLSRLISGWIYAVTN